MKISSGHKLLQFVFRSGLKPGLTLALMLSSTQVLAHAGHMANETVHGFVHIEHIVSLAALGVIAYVVNILRNR